MRQLLLLVTGTFDHAVCFQFLCSLRGIVAI
ncbi:unnamed protein product [Acanthoscelides obtectus]|uniref:Uncharacterized protein n=1 Tax=Acanthoscelides obtectus TaxID=200917 RepID=A0A9P0PZU1_ACAOB|nr:unnamed protein product [Acanthoscelides obtectus]CAK1646925.1 hypothetical protein AOBTE_LOCUS14946 [Acanthoscelides obtectus]